MGSIRSKLAQGNTGVAMTLGDLIWIVPFEWVLKTQMQQLCIFSVFKKCNALIGLNGVTLYKDDNGEVIVGNMMKVMKTWRMISLG